jgi:hypothetical protein
LSRFSCRAAAQKKPAPSAGKTTQTPLQNRRYSVMHENCQDDDDW